ncbi:MAG: helix-turn-helix domain-containing protein, partial [Candidatus Lokiarchaeia archaeon]
MASSVTKTIMENIGLNSEEAKLYEAILLNGTLTPGEISVYVEFPVEKVESLLQKLEKQQIVRKMPGVVIRYSVTPPFRPLEKSLEKFKKEAGSLRETLDQKFKEFLIELANSVTVWKSDVNAIIDTEFAIASNENKAITKNLDQVTLQTSKALRTEAEKKVKEVSKTIESQSEHYNNQIYEYENGLQRILDTQVEKNEKEKELREKDLTERIDSDFKYYVDNLQNLNKKIQKALSENSKILLESLNQIEAKNIDLLEKSSLKFDELANEAKNKAYSVLDNHQNDFTTDVTELLSTADRTFQDQIKIREENLGLLHNSIEQTILENSIENAKTLSKIHQLTSIALNKLYRKHEKDVESISEKLTELVYTGYNRASSIIEEVKVSIDEYLDSHIKSLNREYKNFQKEFINTVNAGNKNLVGTCDNLQKYHTDTLNQQLNLNIETAENLKNKIGESFKKNIQEINSTLANIQNNVKEILQAELGTYDTNLQNV